MSKVKIKDVKYLALEGGGGKGVAYLGAIKAMEGIGILPINIKGNLPKYNTGTRVVSHDRTQGGAQIQGISGSSAGAITAFCLALGMGSDELLEVLKMKTTYFERKMSVFNSFFDAPGIERGISTHGSVAKFAAAKLEQGNEMNLMHFHRTVEPKSGSDARNTPMTRLTFNEIDVAWGIPGFIRDRVVGKLVPYSDKSIVDALLGFTGNTRELQPIGEPKAMYHFYNLLNGGGLFTGLKVRQFFVDVMMRHFFKNEKLGHTIAERMFKYNNEAARIAARKIDFKAESKNDQFVDPAGFTTAQASQMRYTISKIDPGMITFRQFFYITGVDLVITGTNITNGIPLYFSAARTPDFPVIEAVMLSMNLPILFSPVHVLSNVYLDAEDYTKFVGEKPSTSFGRYNAMYRGLYVDGGVLNNLPMHAFDSVASPFNEYIDPRSRKSIFKFNKAVVSLRLTDGFRGDANANDGITRIREDLGLFSMLGKLLGTTMFYSEVGQIREAEEFDHVIHCYTHHLSTENFYSPAHFRDLPVMEAFLSTSEYFGYYKPGAIQNFERYYPPRPNDEEGIWELAAEVERTFTRQRFADQFPEVRTRARNQSKSFIMPIEDQGNSNKMFGMESNYTTLVEELAKWTN
jgi:predicted acylesterase/phospholipase RssA